MSMDGYQLTVEVFEKAERRHPDLMEPWSTRVGGCDDASGRQALMRAGLAATFRQRYPMPDHFWRTDQQSAVSP
jgi:hypothetical protein